MKSTLKIILLLSLLFFALEQFFSSEGSFSLQSKAEMSRYQAPSTVFPEQ